MRIPGGSSVVLGAEDDVVPAGHGRPGALGAADPTARARTTIAVLLAVLRLVLGLILRGGRSLGGLLPRSVAPIVGSGGGVLVIVSGRLGPHGAQARRCGLGVLVGDLHDVGVVLRGTGIRPAQVVDRGLVVVRGDRKSVV